MKLSKVPTPSGEESNSNFPGPKAQELLTLGIKIQRRDNAAVAEMIDKNPRLLCTSADAPTILQEGARYNALHIAARWGNLEAATLILSTVSSISYMVKLYPDDKEIIRHDRTKNLAVSYLNTPDKIALDTPLHYACKFNWYDVVSILLSHPLCDRNRVNLDNKTAECIIGSRVPKEKEVSAKIRKLFHNDKIVPIWRDPNCREPAVIGVVVDPKCLGSLAPSPFYEHFKDIDFNLFGPIDPSLIPPSQFGVQKVINAFAGPMEQAKAEQFLNVLRQSGKGGLSQDQSRPSSAFSPIPGNAQSPIQSNFGELLRTPNKWSSPVSPIQTSTPIRLATGTDSTFPLTPRFNLSIGLSSSLNRSSPCPQTLQDRALRLADPDKGIERVARKYSKEMKVEFLEYWKFAGKFLDLTSEYGLEELESRLNEMEKVVGLLRAPEFLSPVSGICRALNDCHLATGLTPRKPEGACWKNDWRSGLYQKNSLKPNSNFFNPDTPQEGKALVKPVEGVSDISPPIKFIARRLSFGDAAASPDFSEPEECSDPDSISRSFDLLNLSNSDDSPLASEKTPAVRIGNPQKRFAKDDGFFTPSSSPVPDTEVYEDCKTYEVYLNGIRRGKEDFQAHVAIAGIIDELPGYKFPAIIRWHNSLKALGNCDRKRRL